jgi:uncharacterized membrane-anchored protein YjiN (DUF445 family)
LARCASEGGSIPELIPVSIPGEAEKLARLRAMKRLPLILLLLMLVLFLVTLHRPESWAGWVNAFAEAGMIGALADWFAVVALFRHPLGIPIPHTAIIPRRKDEIGESLARFVAEHFLHPDVVQVRLQDVNMAAGIADWVRTGGGRERVSEIVATALLSSLRGLHEERVRDFIRRLSRRRMASINPAPVLGRTLDWLIRDGRHQQILTQALRFAIITLHENRTAIRENVQRESPWWLPGFVDDRIVQQMLDRIEGLLLEMSLDPDHPVRGQFNERLQAWAEELQSSAQMERWGDRLRKTLLENQELQDYLYRLWSDLSSGLEADLENPDSAIREQLGQWLEGWAEELARDDEMQAWVNGWLIESAVTLVERNRHGIASLISETVKSWDARDTSYRVELAIGKDLQYIRINGTLVGGLVGLVIHAVK